MMKRILFASLFLLICIPVQAQEQIARMTGPIVAGGSVSAACATSNSGGNHSITEEGFEGAGYENAAFWTETGTIDEDTACPASGPTGSCSQCISAAFTGANYISHNYGAGADTSIAVSFWVYYDTAVTNLESCSLFSASELGFASFYTITVTIERSTNAYFKFVYNGGSANSGTITTGNWYQVNLKITQNATSYMLVKDINGDNVGSEVSGTGYNQLPQYLFFGSGSEKTSGLIYIDLIHVDGDATNYAY